MLRKSLAFLAAASLTVTPALAQSSASSLSLASSVRAGPSAAESDLEGQSAFPMIAFAAIVIGGVLLATGVIFDDDDDDNGGVPQSP